MLLALGVAILANCRPYEGLIFCLPLAAALAWWLFRPGRLPATRSRWTALAPAAAVLAAAGAFMAYNNWRVTGNALLFPYVVNDRAYLSTPHFAWQKLEPPLPLRNPQMDAIFNGWCRNVWQRDHFALTPNGIQWGLVHKLEVLQQFYLPVGLLLPVVLAWRRLLSNRKALFLFVVCASTVLGLIPVVWFQRHYAAAATAGAIGLAVMALRYLRTWRPKGRPVGIGLTRALVSASLLLIPMNLILSWNGHTIQNPAPRWVSDRNSIAAQLQALPGPQLVLVHYSTAHDAAQEWVYNRADIDASKVVWAQQIPGLDLGPLLDYFHGRRIWRLDVDSLPPKLEAFPAAQSP